MRDVPEDLTRDAILDGRVVLLQPRRGHRVGSDAVLLAAAAGAVEGASVVDLGCGVGAVGLAMAARAGRVLLVDSDPAILALAARNAELNGMSGKAAAIEADILAPAARRREAGLENGVHDVVLTNPPFLEAGTSRSSPVPGRSRAHDMPAGGLDAWIANALALLKPGGRFVLIHRADALAAILAALDRRAGSIRVLPVHPDAGRPAARVIVGAVKGRRGPLAILPPLVLAEAGGRFTPCSDAVHRGRAGLDLWP